MQPASFPLIGRASELQTLERSLAQAERGRGSLWLVSGEAGIGKSRLVEELAERALEAGFCTSWGRCWEVGGAPAYWPWIQVLRGYLRVCGAKEALAPGRRQKLEQLLPELRESDDSEAAQSIDPERARFQLLDAVVGTLGDGSAKKPLLIVLEDLHTADASSLSLLDFMARQVRGARLLVVGTHRPVDLEQTSVGQALARLSRDAQRMSLGPLGRAAVVTYLETMSDQTHARASDEALAERLLAVTEGNPLFIGEVLRSLVSHGALAKPGAPLAIPSTVRSAISERLCELSGSVLETLQAASVLGRDFRDDALAELRGVRRDVLAGFLEEATRKAVLHEVGEGEHRFAHILIREVLYQGIQQDDRKILHRDVARILEARRARGDEIANAEIAFHGLEGSESGLALPAARRAAGAALAQWAFDEAAEWLERALILHERMGGPALERAELLIELGRARLSAGDLDLGRAACRKAALIARSEHEPELLARAALEYGSVFVFGEVSSELVALLEEARARLGATNAALSALVLARLAAAMQPSRDVAEPIVYAKEAIARARDLGDEATLLAVLRSACSALMDLYDPAARRVLNREHVELALRLGDVAEQWRGRLRLFFDCCELGDFVEARRTLSACRELADALGYPIYQWRIVALEAALASRQGRFADAERAMATAKSIADDARDPNAARNLLLQRFCHLRLMGRPEQMMELLPELEAACGNSQWSASWHRLLSVAALAAAGDGEAVRRKLDDSDLELLLAQGDLSLLELVVDAAVALGDEALARRLLTAMSPHPRRFVSWGMVGLFVGGPAARELGRLCTVLRRFDEAERHFELANDLAERTDCRPIAGLIALERALVRVARGDRASARSLVDEAARTASDLGMETLLRRAECVATELDERPAQSPAPSASQTEAGAFRMFREGELWTLEHGDRLYRLRDSRGLRILARLVHEPGRELHVLDLMEASGSSELDGGDCGELLDQEARRDYERRIRSLRDELAEAEEFNDAARAHKLREEEQFLVNELSRAMGLGGRARRAGSAAERARVNVQRRLKDAQRRIEEQDEGLGRHLTLALRTGTFCSYQP